MKFWPTILISITLTGCVSYQPKPISPAQSAARLEARRLDDAGLQKFFAQNSRATNSWPLAEWDLDSLTLAAFYFQPNLAVARAQWHEAVAAIKTAGARPNPTVSVGPGYNFSAAAGVEPWMPFGSVDLPMETAGKRGKRISQAEQIAESARQTYIAAAWQTHANVRAALVDYVVARKKFTLIEKQFSAQQEIASRQEQRLAGGDISRADLTVTRIALTKAQMDLSDAETGQAEARAKLAEAIGVPVPGLSVAKIIFDLEAGEPKDLTSDDALSLALCGRADVRAALADYAVAEDSLRLEIAKQFPDLHLNPGYQFDQGEHKWTLGLNFELPVLDQNQGPIREAKARRETAAAKFTVLQAQIIAALDRALGDFQAANDQIKTSAAFFADAQKQLDSANAQFEAGAASRMDVLGAEIEFSAAALARLDAQAKLQTAIGALEDAVQRPMDSLAIAVRELQENSREKKSN